MGVECTISSIDWAWDYLGVMTKCPGRADTQTRQTKTCLLPLLSPPAASIAGKCRFLIAWPPANKWDCLNLFLVGRRRSVVVRLPIIRSISHLSSPGAISYRPSSPAAQSLIRSWGSQAPLMIPFPCIDNPASPLHTRTLAHALQPPLALASSSLFFALHHSSKKTAAVAHDLVSLCPRLCLCLPACLSKPATTTGHHRRHIHLNHEQTPDLDISVQCAPELGPRPWRRRGRR